MLCLQTAQHQCRFGKRWWKQQDSFQPKLSKCSQQEAIAALNSSQPTTAEEGQPGKQLPSCDLEIHGGIICWEQINVCSCNSWHIISSGRTGLLFVPSGRGHLLSLGEQHLHSLPLWGQFARRALAPRDELPLPHHTAWGNYCAHCCWWKEYRGDLPSPHPPRLLDYLRYS